MESKLDYKIWKEKILNVYNSKDIEKALEFAKTNRIRYDLLHPNGLSPSILPELIVKDIFKLPIPELLYFDDSSKTFEACENWSLPPGNACVYELPKDWAPPKEPILKGFDYFRTLDHGTLLETTHGATLCIQKLYNNKIRIVSFIQSDYTIYDEDDDGLPRALTSLDSNDVSPVG